MQAWQAAAEGSTQATKPSQASKDFSKVSSDAGSSSSSQLAKAASKEFARDYSREFSSRDYYSKASPSKPQQQQQSSGKVQQLQAYKGRSLLAVSGCDANMKVSKHTLTLSNQLEPAMNQP
jgi:hypothetical protein